LPELFQAPSEDENFPKNVSASPNFHKSRRKFPCQLFILSICDFVFDIWEFCALKISNLVISSCFQVKEFFSCRVLNSKQTRAPKTSQKSLMSLLWVARRIRRQQIFTKMSFIFLLVQRRHWREAQAENDVSWFHITPP
jgi:hypothetical protein